MRHWLMLLLMFLCMCVGFVRLVSIAIERPPLKQPIAKQLARKSKRKTHYDGVKRALCEIIAWGIMESGQHIIMFCGGKNHLLRDKYGKNKRMPTSTRARSHF